jgi:dipeptidase D
VSDLTTLEPGVLWQYFLGLSRIPRGSKNEAAAIAWVANQGRLLGCEVEQDVVGNVLIRKRAAPGRGNRPSLALQCHVDMVCEKNEGTPHDFTKDPIDIVLDGDMVRARGTTLGADNGIGVASALAVLAARDVRHPAIEALFTVDEETGLTGANNLRAGWLSAGRLLNLDSEEEGELTIGCAGGVDTVATRRVTWEVPPAGRNALRIRILGLKGGHSGIDIGAGRGNALRILGQVLQATVQKHGLRLAAVRGGNKRNAIAREASAVVLVEPGRQEELAEDVARLCRDWRAVYSGFDPNLSMTLELGVAERMMSEADGRAVIGILLAGPHGVEAMSPDIAGLVQTSTNMGLVDTRGDVVEVCFLSRSSIDASKAALAERIAATAALAGFDVEQSGGYPGWKPDPSSAIVSLVDGVHRELYGKPMVIKAIHAGLECGLIGEKYPGIDMASIGPSMWDVHTPDEHVSIRSVAAFWELLVAVLEKA